jgi:hypothetical protein
MCSTCHIQKRNVQHLPHSKEKCAALATFKREMCSTCSIPKEICAALIAFDRKKLRQFRNFKIEL